MSQEYEGGKDLEERYRQMAKDKERAAEALEWAEWTVEDVADLLVEELLQSGPEFQKLVAKKASALKPFAASSGPGALARADARPGRVAASRRCGLGV